MKGENDTNITIQKKEAFEVAGINAKNRRGCEMKIIKRHRYGEETAEIFAVYWDEERSQTLFLGMTDKYSGVYVYSENEVEIVNPNINFRTIYLSGHLPGVFHWALIEKNLLDEVIDGNSELTKNFLDILRSENVIDW